MRVLVTGGAGFIGSHVVEAMLAAGHEVMAFDDLSSGKRQNLDPRAKLVVGDIRDRAALDRAFEAWRPEAVDHHAAQISVRRSVEDPGFDAQINIGGGLNVFEACVRHGVKRLIFASTGGAIYGEQETYPAAETHPAAPLSPYGVAKLSLEKYLFFYEQTHRLHWTALRYSNVYGPRQDPHGEAGVVAIFCQLMLAGQIPTLNGDGGQTRDFVHVRDVARANRLALERGPRGPINIGTGIETDINAIWRLIREFAGAAIEARHGAAKPGEQRRSLLDPGLAKKLLGWSPEVGLREGLAGTVEYFRKNRGA